MIRGRHNIRAGFDFRLMHLGNYQSAFAGGTFAFDQGFTRANYLTADSLSGSSIASALLGAAASGGVDYIASPYYSWRYYAPWVQDDIKVTRRLTLNIGLRWDLLGPLSERYNRLNYGFFAGQLNPISSQIDQKQFPGYKAYGGIGFTGLNGLPRTAFNTDWNNIQPRVGAAFQLTPTTVLRAGFGTSYIPQVSFGYNYGFSQNTPYVSTTDAGQTPAGAVSNPFPNGLLAPPGSKLGLQTLLGQAPNFADPSGRIGYVYSFSFGIQKQLGNQVRVEASYVGSRSHDAGASNSFNSLCFQSGARRRLQGRQSELSQSEGSEPVPGIAARHVFELGHCSPSATLIALPAVHQLHPAEHPHWQGLVQLAAGERAEALLTRLVAHGLVYVVEKYSGPRLPEPDGPRAIQHDRALRPHSRVRGRAGLRTALWSRQGAAK